MSVPTAIHHGCGRSNETVKHAQKSLFIRDMPSHGKSVAIHLNVPRLRCKLCNQTFTVQEKVKVRKKPRFDEIHMERLYCMLSVMAEDDFEIRIQSRQVNLGADLSTLEADLDAGKFEPVKS